MPSPMVTTGFDQTNITISKNVKISTAAALQLWPKEFPFLVEVEKGTYRTEKMMGYEGVGQAPEQPEGTDPTSKELVEGYIESATHKTYMQKMAITWEMQVFAEANQRFQALIGQYNSRSVMLVMENQAASLLLNGFAVASSGDGQPYFSASHVYKVGTSYSNLQTSADLDKTTLESALKATHTQVMEYGTAAQLQAEKIGISTDNIFVLPELLKSTLDPESANNTYNAFMDWGLKKFMSHYLQTDTDMWWVDTNLKTRTMYKGTGFEMWSEVSQNKTLNELVGTMIAVGTHHPQGSIGNAGL